MTRHRPSDTPSPIGALLDDALLDLLVISPDPRAQAFRRRQRMAGTMLLLLASACMIAITGLPLDSASMLMGTIVVGASAVVLMLIGAWLIDRAGKQELSEHREGLAKCIGESMDEPTRALANRQRHFGIGMLALAIFCVCASVAPFPGKGSVDVLMWAGFSVVFIAIGAWQIETAYKAARRAQELADAVRLRKSAQAGGHLRRVQ